MPVFQDQLNRLVTLSILPKRIISLVPSQTELLFTLGLDVEIIGITKFCIHPGDKVTHKAKIGGTKQLNIHAIRNLGPDLIIANKEENEQSQIEELATQYPVWISDVADLNSALDMIIGIGEIVGREKQASKLTADIKSLFIQLQPSIQNISVAYLIWRKPYMAAGKGTFIDAMLQSCGLLNVVNTERYPEISVEDLIGKAPTVLMLSSEPYPFAQKHIAELQRVLPGTKIILVDGEMFSWYGSRLHYAPGYFKDLVEGLQQINDKVMR